MSTSSYNNQPATDQGSGFQRAVPDPGYTPHDEGPRHAATDHSQVAEVAGQGVHDVKEQALAKASESKDAVVERGADVVAVAKDEAADLVQEAQAQFRSLWLQASTQVNEQLAIAQRQLADLVRSLAGELGEMSAKSEQHGPLTSLARHGASRGGALSHWLTNAHTGDVLVEVRRFARKRPMAFLAGAAAAGVLVGRLGRGLMAPDDSVPATGTGDPAADGSRTNDLRGSSVPLFNDATAEASDDSGRYADSAISRPVVAGEVFEAGPR